MILSNQARCLKCGDTPFSAHVHDYRSCACGAIAVDGGMHYLRRVGDLSAIEEMSIEFPDEAAKAFIAGFDQVIGDDQDYCETDFLRVLHEVMEAEGVSIDRSAEQAPMAVTFGIATALIWAYDNGRNGLGMLCAVARHVRDAGGVWKFKEPAIA